MKIQRRDLVRNAIGVMSILVFGTHLAKWVRSGYRVNVSFKFDSKESLENYLKTFPLRVEDYRKIREINEQFKSAGLLLDVRSERNWQRFERNLDYRFLDKASYHKWIDAVESSGAFSFSEATQAKLKFEITEAKFA